MKLLKVAFSFLLISNVFAFDECNKRIPDLDHTGEIYVVCKSLNGITKEEASSLIDGLFAGYDGPDAEIPVFFISNSNLVGKSEFKADELVAFYYTHNNILVLWPEHEIKREEIELW